MNLNLFLGKLGIDPLLLFAQIFNLIILLWILKKIFIVPILMKLSEDEKSLALAKTELENLQKDKDKYQEEQSQSLKKTKEEAIGIISEAEEIAKKIKDRAYQESEEEKNRVISQIQSRLKDTEKEGA